VSDAACTCDPVRPDGKPWYAHQPGCPLREVRQMCPYCGRYTAMFDHPEYGRVMMGHRVSVPPSPDTPWCEGGGRSV
jgi:ribosomal protein S27AE